MSENAVNKTLQEWDETNYEGKLIIFKKVMKDWHERGKGEDTRAALYRRALKEDPELQRDFNFMEEVYRTGSAFPMSPSDRLWNAYKNDQLQDQEIKQYLELYDHELSDAAKRKLD